MKSYNLSILCNFFMCLIILYDILIVLLLVAAVFGVLEDYISCITVARTI